jgi:hypothetical protein
MSDPNCPHPVWGADGPKGHPKWEVKQQSEFTGYFSTPSGDLPVVVVANNIEEATKILRLPGAISPSPQDPIRVDFTRGKIGSAVPVHHIGFETVLYGGTSPSSGEPIDPALFGAYATPKHYDVINGENVIFSAFEPFGWVFEGWYRGHPKQPVADWQLLSTRKVAEIEIYDPYATRITIVAKYRYEPKLRSGRYMEFGSSIDPSLPEGSGRLWDLQFEQYGIYSGRIVISPDTADAYYFVMSTLDQSTNTIVCIPDPQITQPQQYQATFTYTLNPSNFAGIGLIVQTISVTNPWGWVGGVTSPRLKWLQKETIFAG